MSGYKKFDDKVTKTSLNIRDWSLITGRGGLQNGRGGAHMKFYPYEKGGGAEKGLSHAEGGHKQFWGSFNVVA